MGEKSSPHCVSPHFAVFKDHSFGAPIGCNADDVAKALAADGLAWGFIDEAELAGTIDTAGFSCIILPYDRGNFSSAALAALSRFHESGGGLLWLGHLRYKETWYPRSNAQIYDFRVTAYPEARGECNYSGSEVGGLT